MAAAVEALALADHVLTEREWKLLGILVVAILTVGLLIRNPPR